MNCNARITKDQMLSGLAEKASSLTCTLDPEALRSGKELMNTAQGLAKDMDVVSNVAKQFCKSVDNWLGNLMVILLSFCSARRASLILTLRNCTTI